MCTDWVHHSENFSVNTMKKYFASNLLSQGSNERDYLLKDVKNSVLGMFNKNMNFSTEQLKQQQQFMTCYYSLHFVFLKMAISIPLK